MLTTSHSLIARLRQPEVDSQAWDRFVTLYTELLYHWARGWGMQPADISDVIQDVLLVLLRDLKSYQPTPNGRFRGWLRMVTRNRVRALRRKRFPDTQIDLLEQVQETPESHQARDAAEELALLTRRAAELLQNDFQPSTWKAFWETAVLGRSGVEVAAELGVPVNTVYAARFRVQQRIREELADFFD